MSSEPEQVVLPLTVHIRFKFVRPEPVFAIQVTVTSGSSPAEQLSILLPSSMEFPQFLPTSKLASPSPSVGAPLMLMVTISRGEFRGAKAPELRERANLQIRKTNKGGLLIRLTRGQAPERIQLKQP